MKNLDQYINTKESKTRVQLLTDAKKSGEHLPLGFVEDILCLNIPTIEKISLLSLANSSDSIALEHFLLSGISRWEQDLATFALRKWVQSTDHLLWFRLIGAATDKLTAQRVQYTILDQCSPFGGRNLIEVFQNRAGIEDLSPAFHSLIFQRSLERDMKNENIDQLAFSCLEELTSGPHPDNKALTSAIGWIARHHPRKIESLKADISVPESWRDILICVSNLIKGMDKKSKEIHKFVSSDTKTKNIAKLIGHWPPLSLRHLIPVDTVAKSIEFMTQCSEKQMKPVLTEGQPWRLFAGISPDTFSKAIEKIDSDVDFAKAIAYLSPILDTPLQAPIFGQVIDRLSKTDDPGGFLASLDLRLRLELTQANNSTESLYKKLFTEEKETIEGKQDVKIVDYQDKTDSKSDLPETIKERAIFFNSVYKNGTTNSSLPSNHYWVKLKDNWFDPNEKDLQELASEARKSPELFKLCYIETLGKFKGLDSAALKLLDFIRSSEETVMLSVINSLAGIGTPRALQELIACITRPNITPFLRLEICNRLQEFNLEKLQSELRSSIEDLNLRPEYDDEVQELVDAISNLLVPLAEVATETTVRQSTTAGKDLDSALSVKIPQYGNLSSEVKRALRTAQFFHNQIEGTEAVNLIDLSPVIDMQYKALELLFRESFEETAFALINEGILQRKLDVIGYARPIPKTMDEFERYIGSLPTIDTIPYFSKFKLRKMLRAICQYRPGKRFTLDGIKAFALFFVCFGRRECRYGLSNIINLGFENDKKLFEFGKALHIFQDFRNRAAHEGFHPDAHNDIDGIWISTSEIIQNVFSIKNSFKKTVSMGHHGAAKAVPLIERKQKFKAS